MFPIIVETVVQHDSPKHGRSGARAGAGKRRLSEMACADRRIPDHLVELGPRSAGGEIAAARLELEVRHIHYLPREGRELGASPSLLGGERVTGGRRDVVAARDAVAVTGGTLFSASYSVSITPGLFFYRVWRSISERWRPCREAQLYKDSEESDDFDGGRARL
jgi:hypothetical protein